MRESCQVELFKFDRIFVQTDISDRTECLGPYHVESTSSRLITAVKQHWAMLVLGWVTAWEYMVLYTFWLEACIFEDLRSLDFHQTYEQERVCLNWPILFKGNVLAKCTTWLMEIPGPCLNDQNLTLEIKL